MSNCKCKFNSIFGSIHEMVITDTGISRISRANLNFGDVIGAAVAMDGDVVDSDDSPEEDKGTFKVDTIIDVHLAAASCITCHALCMAFLLWKQKPCLPSAQAPTTSFHIITVDISDVLKQSVDQAPDELANVSLLKSGYLSCSPLQPTLAISLSCLELYHQIHWRKPSFSVQAMVECTYFQSLCDQFAVMFDAYLAIACKQPNDPSLYPARLDAFDGNSSLKHIDGSGHTDRCSFQSSYLIPAAEVKLFKDNVRLHPGTQTTVGNEVHPL
ncbi:hypothetical protein EDB19DRAFT_1825400 [Suillus lakei]|nr:hypothetical protein EDB19DRAFT_1825400 [Suillus lakei]